MYLKYFISHPTHPTFNVIEYISLDIKRETCNINVTGNMSMDKLLRETEETINKLSINRWQAPSNHFQKLELKYWEKDNIIEET